RSVVGRATRARASFHVEAVAGALDGHHSPTLLAQLGAQPADVHVDGARFDLVGTRVTPRALEQLLTTEHAPGRLQQRTQQLELLRGERDRLTSDGHPVSPELQHDATRGKSSIRVDAYRAPEHRTDARHQLLRRKRFRDVIVGAELEADD